VDPSTLPVRSDGFYRTLVENASEGMITIDEDSRIVYANPAVEEILGYEPEELIGSPKMEIIPERLRSTHLDALTSYVETDERNIDWNGIELPALHREGHEVPTLISLREHEHDGERFFTGIIRDISDRKEREEQLRNQKERLDEFADILAHDIKNPLGVAQGYTEIANDTYEAPELDHIAESLDRIDELVDDVLELSKDGQFVGDTEAVDVARCVRGAWDVDAATPATLAVDDDVGRVVADESRFRELLGNLLGNAVIHAGPDVTVRVGRLPEGDGLFVEDDGPGIPESERDAAFEQGYTTREDGTGYGLAIVKQIAEAHGWSVSLWESDAGGARFEITDVEFLN